MEGKDHKAMVNSGSDLNLELMSLRKVTNIEISQIPSPVHQHTWQTELEVCLLDLSRHIWRPCSFCLTAF